MELTMSMFATQADYWKARAELAETTVAETAEALGCKPDNEEMLGRVDKLRSALTELRDRIMGHPAYANLTEDEECDVGGDTAELSYLARVANAALDA